MSLEEILAGTGRRFTEAERKQIEAYRQLSRDVPVSERQVMLDWSPLFCTCRPRLALVTADIPPGHAHCLVHGAYMVTWDGRVL